VSLVLEALKKLDREKGRDERGFVVMAAAPWPTRAARRWPAWAALGVATAGAIVAVLALRTSSAPPAPAVVPPAPAARSDAARVVEATPPPAAASVATTAAPRSTPARVAPKPATEPTPLPAAIAPPPAAAARPDPGPRLQAISERDGQPIAMINDHLVRVGDELDGMRVIAIRVDEVDIEVRGRRTTLRF
jgi:hypothetical protein